MTIVSLIDVLFKRSMVVSVLLMVFLILDSDNLWCALNKNIAVCGSQADCKLYLSQTLCAVFTSVANIPLHRIKLQFDAHLQVSGSIGLCIHFVILVIIHACRC